MQRPVRSHQLRQPLQMIAPPEGRFPLTVARFEARCGAGERDPDLSGHDAPSSRALIRSRTARVNGGLFLNALATASTRLSSAMRDLAASNSGSFAGRLRVSEPTAPR